MRFRYPLLALAAIAVAAALFFVLSGEDPEGETVRGKPGQGFPLRGSLADDTDAIEGAVSAWREASEEPDEDDEAGRDDPLRDARPDEDDDVAVLWAGRADERDVVVMKSSEMVAEVTRRPDGAWDVEGERRSDRSVLDSLPVGASGAVVVPDRGRWRYVNAGDSSSSGLEDVGDGLFYGGRSAQDGFVVPETASEDNVGIYVTQVGARLMSPEAFTTLQKGLDGGNARAIWLAANEANGSLREGLRRYGQDSEPPTSAEALEVVWTGRIPGHPHAAVVVQGRDYFGLRSAALGWAGAEERSDEGGAQALGFNTSTQRRSDARDAFVAGTYAEIDDVPYLVLAGSNVETIHALVGDQEISRPAPFALIDARRFVQTEGEPDTVIYGVTAEGNVVSPLDAP